ncbi:hypothetical protein [Piscibacillus salipiscarius]|uniref:Uncharacterized protein n=1 Tax=Piscibacillus salipiscarius TaxID=299480 RepID=A0ABW5QAJ5_9BACI|nr:hypothetical protein [Piscibacillus salipiscarius]
MEMMMYVVTLMVLMAAAFLLYKGLNRLFVHRKKALNLKENDSRHINSK